MLFAGTALFYALEQVFHAPAQFGGDVGLEMQLGDPKKLQAAGDFAAQERGGVFQGGDGLRGIRALVHADAHQGVALVGRDLDAGDGGGS